MADLLECLIQVKGLEHSIARLERFLAEVPSHARPAVEAALDRLIEAERAYAGALPGGTPTPRFGVPEAKRQRFAAARRSNLQSLDRCSAEDLGRPVDWPGRPGISVADLVAIMLAHDTDCIAEIQRAKIQP